MTSAPTYDLPARATISECGHILTSLRQLIEDHQGIVVTCGKVEQSDLAILQVLISARKTALRDNKSFSIVTDGNGTFDALLTEYGLCFGLSA